MSNLPVLNLRPSKTDRAEDDRVRKLLQEFSESGSLQTAERLRQIALPASDFAGSICLSHGQWIAEIRYDHLLHEGEGQTEAAALVDAVLRIMAAAKT